MNAHVQSVSGFSFESPREFRARVARVATRDATQARLDAVNDKIALRRQHMRDAYNDLPTPGYGSGPDEDDAWLIDRFKLAVDLLRQAYHERGRIRVTLDRAALSASREGA